jgi:hypothetical protein
MGTNPMLDPSTHKHISYIYKFVLLFGTFFFAVIFGSITLIYNSALAIIYYSVGGGLLLFYLLFKKTIYCRTLWLYLSGTLFFAYVQCGVILCAFSCLLTLLNVPLSVWFSTLYSLLLVYSFTRFFLRSRHGWQRNRIYNETVVLDLESPQCNVKKKFDLKNSPPGGLDRFLDLITLWVGPLLLATGFTLAKLGSENIRSAIFVTLAMIAGLFLSRLTASSWLLFTKIRFYQRKGRMVILNR